MKRKRVLAAIAAVAPLVLWAQSQSTVIIDSTTAAPAKVEPKKAYVPHKTPDAPKKAASAPRKPAAPKEPKPPAAPKKPSSVPAVIYDKQGNAIPTSPDAYDVSSAKKK